MRDMLDSQNPELEAAGSRQSWHDLYKSSSWIYVGGLDYGLTEGDIEAVFSQYGKIVQLNYVKDRDTGKPKGFSFINFEDQRSTVLSVDNLNGIRLCNRFLKVDHVRDYKPPDFNDGPKPRREGRPFKDKRGGGSGYSYSNGREGLGSSSNNNSDRKRPDRPGFGYSRRDIEREAAQAASSRSSRRSRSSSSSSDSSRSRSRSRSRSDRRSKKRKEIKQEPRSPQYRDISP